jgi:hypothetical protein
MNLRRSAFLVSAALLGILGIWLLIAYLLAPMGWKLFSSRHHAITAGPRITTAGAGIHGDPLNISIIGDEDDLLSAMLVAGWYPADPITFKSSLRIAESTVFHRPYIEAPVSNLFLFGPVSGSVIRLDKSLIIFLRILTPSVTRRSPISNAPAESRASNGKTISKTRPKVATAVVTPGKPMGACRSLR